MTSPLPLAERFAVLDFRAVPYEAEPSTRYQAILVDRAKGWCGMNAVRLNAGQESELRGLAWTILKMWAEETALARLHGLTAVDVEHVGGRLGCETCEPFFAWLKAGGFGEVPA